MEKVTDKSGIERRITVDKSRIVHLRFNTFGDEFTGVSSLQPVYNTAIRLMNMESAAAEAAVKTANPTWVVSTESKSPSDLAIWAKVLGRVSAKEVVFLPLGVTTELKSPGNQNFSEYSDYFLNAVVSALAVPKSVLTGSSDSGGGNRSTIITLSKHFYGVIRANQRYMESIFNDVFTEYGEIAGFKPPQLSFNDIAEDADRNGQRAVELYQAGLMTIEEARSLIGLETKEDIKKELLEVQTTEVTPKNVDEQKKSNMEAWHPEEPGRVAGSQRGNKRELKITGTTTRV